MVKAYIFVITFPTCSSHDCCQRQLSFVSFLFHPQCFLGKNENPIFQLIVFLNSFQIGIIDLMSLVYYYYFLIEPNTMFSDPSISANSNRLQFFANLFDTNEVVFLDPNRYYCIVKTDTYNSIKQELDSSFVNQQKLQKQLLEAQLIAKVRTKQVESYQENLAKMNANQKTLTQNYQTLLERCQLFERNEVEFKQALKHGRAKGQAEVKSAPVRSLKNFTSVSCQTEVILEPFQKPFQEESLKEQPIQTPQVEVAEQKLYELLQSQMERFQLEFLEKVSALEEQRANIDRWAEENRQLREQNEQLKQKIVERNLQEEKLEAWRQSIASFVSRVESTIITPSSHPLQQQEQGEGEVGRLKAQVLELRGRIVEMRAKMRRIDELMESDAEVGDEGAIGVLVRLSQRVKAIVKSMVMEVEQV